jgi:hypothetical protein
MTDKWGRRLFTTGAVVLVLLGLVHSLSLFGKPVPTNDTERQLMDLMTNYKFDVMGSMRNTNGFLRGFSISFMVGMLGLGMLDLVLARERTELLKRVAAVNTVWMATMVVVSLRYFFVFPTSCLTAALLIFAMSWFMLPASAS